MICSNFEHKNFYNMDPKETIKKNLKVAQNPLMLWNNLKVYLNQRG